MWHAVYDDATGRLVSLTTALPAALPAGLASAPLGAAPPADDRMWDAATRAYVARPPKVYLDRLDDLAQHPDFPAFWASLSATQKATLRRVVIWLLGRARWRVAAQPVVVEPEVG